MTMTHDLRFTGPVTALRRRLYTYCPPVEETVGFWYHDGIVIYPDSGLVQLLDISGHAGALVQYLAQRQFQWDGTPLMVNVATGVVSPFTQNTPIDGPDATHIRLYRFDRPLLDRIQTLHRSGYLEVTAHTRETKSEPKEG